MNDSQEICVSLNGPQSLAHQALKPGNTVCTPWGRGVGKSKFQRISWYLLIAEYDGVKRGGQRGVRIVLLAPTFKQAVDVHGQALLDELAREWAFLGGVVNKTRWRVDFPGGSWIQFFGAENAQASRGLRCDVVTIDECDDVDPDVFDAIVNPWLSEPWSLQTKLVAGTPRRGRYGLLWKIWSGAKDGLPGYHAFHATYRDAPNQISQSYVEAVRATTPPSTFAREWECDPDAAEGLVYDIFDEKFHVRSPPRDTRWTEFLIGADHGYEDPGVILEIGVLGSGKDATCWVLNETYQSKQTDMWWVAKGREVIQRRRDARWYCDPSRPGLIQDWKSIGAKIQDVDNSIKDGVAAVADKLVIRKREGGPDYAKLYVAPECKNLIREMGLYRRRRNPRNKEEILEDIEDKNNHCFAAGTLVTTARGDIPIEQVTTQDSVLTRAGFKPVVAAGMTRESAPIWTLRTSDGRTIRGTGDHRIYVIGEGWELLSNLPPLSRLVASDGSDVRVACVDIPRSREPVFDLTVAEQHEFFANGILVHNCMDALRYPILNRFGGVDRRRIVDTDYTFG